MRFKDITTSIQDAWAFVAIPLAQCAAIYLVALLLDPSAALGVQNNALRAAQHLGTELTNAKQVLEPFGLTSLIPIGSFVTVIAFLFLLREPLLNQVSAIPPWLICTPAQLILEKLSNADIALILRRYPSARSFNEACSFALADASQMTPSRISYWGERTATGYEMLSLVKFAFIVSIVLWFSTVTRTGNPWSLGVLKLLVVLMALGVMWCLALASTVHSAKLTALDDVQRILSPLREPLKVAPDELNRRGAREDQGQL